MKKAEVVDFIAYRELRRKAADQTQGLEPDLASAIEELIQRLRESATLKQSR